MVDKFGLNYMFESNLSIVFCELNTLVKEAGISNIANINEAQNIPMYIGVIIKANIQARKIGKIGLSAPTNIEAISSVFATIKLDQFH